MRLRVATACAVAALGGAALGAPAAPAPPEDPMLIEHAANAAYLAAINSNRVVTMIADLTDDVVYQPPNEPEVAGKAAVRKWLTDRVAAGRFHWQKTPIAFTVSGDWAFERFAYRLVNIDKTTAVASTDFGKGVSVFHHDADGKWRVAIDSWSSSLSMPKE
jgi:ketosteroid isomerase-like protein